MLFNSIRNQGGSIIGNVGACNRGNKMIDLFVQGMDKYLWRKEYNGNINKWGNWQSVDNSLVLGSSPIVCNSGANNLLVFVRGEDGQLWHKSWQPQTWTKWIPLGGQIIGQPAAISRNNRVIDVFARGTDNRLWQRVWDGERWLEWKLLDSDLELGSSPTVTSSGYDGLNVFVRGVDGQLWHKPWAGEQGWKKWQPLGGKIIDHPSAICNGRTITVFAKGLDLQLWYIIWDGYRWKQWEEHDPNSIGIILDSSPTVILVVDRPWLFCKLVNNENAVFEFYYDPPVIIGTPPPPPPPPPIVTSPWFLTRWSVWEGYPTWEGTYPGSGIIMNGVIKSINVPSDPSGLIRPGDSIRFINPLNYGIYSDIPAGGKLEGAELMKFTSSGKTIHIYTNHNQSGSSHDSGGDMGLSITHTTS